MVQAGTVTGGIDFALERGGQIRGVATDAGTGRLLANVTVDVLDEASRSLARATTTAQGVYITPGLPPGTYHVRATPGSGFLEQMYQLRDCAPGACSILGATPVVVMGSQTTGGVDFPLQCRVSLGAEAVTLPAAGEARTITVTATAPECRWRAVPDPDAPWLTVDETPHVGSGTVQISASSNGGEQRRASPLVAGLPVAVTQASRGALTYYLAEGATGAFFDLDIAIANPNPAEAPVTVRFSTPAGVAVTKDVTIGALRRTTIRVDDIAGLEDTAVSTQVTSADGLPLVVERTMFWGSDGQGGHGGTAVEAASQRWYFAEGFQGFFDTYVLILNPGTVAASCTLTFLLDGEPPVSVEMTVGPEQRASLWTGSVPALAGKAFGIVVDADQPEVAERAMYFVENRWEGGHESAGVTAPATQWYLAEGATGSFFDTYVLVGNPNDYAVDAVFTFLLPDGSTVTATRGIAAWGRLTVPVATLDAALVSTAFSTSVQASGPVVVERAMYWPRGRWAEAHDSTGVTEAATRWGLAEGRVGGDQGFETYILVANPAAETADVKVTFLQPDADPVERAFLVPAMSRFNIQLDTGSVPAGLGHQFGAVVESVNGVPIVVERAMYWNAGGETWAGGSDVVAVRLPR